MKTLSTAKTLSLVTELSNLYQRHESELNEFYNQLQHDYNQATATEIFRLYASNLFSASASTSTEESQQ